MLALTRSSRDGLPQKAIDFSGFKVEPYALERVEVLKGPASVLYGANEVGGLVNLVTKRPTKDPLYSAYASYGSFNTYESGYRCRRSARQGRRLDLPPDGTFP